MVGLLFLTALPDHAAGDVNVIDIGQTEYLLKNVKNDPSNTMTKENLAQAIGDKKVVVFYCTGMLRAYHALKQAEQWSISAEMYWYKNGYEEWKMLQPVAD